MLTKLEMEVLIKLLRDSYDLQEEKPDKTAYWHLQQLRAAMKLASEANDTQKKTRLITIIK